jgi:hypothetical protein
VVTTLKKITYIALAALMALGLSGCSGTVGGGGGNLPPTPTAAPQTIVGTWEFAYRLVDLAKIEDLTEAKLTEAGFTGFGVDGTIVFVYRDGKLVLADAETLEPDPNYEEYASETLSALFTSTFVFEEDGTFLWTVKQEYLYLYEPAMSAQGLQNMPSVAGTWEMESNGTDGIFTYSYELNTSGVEIVPFTLTDSALVMNSDVEHIYYYLKRVN